MVEELNRPLARRRKELADTRTERCFTGSEPATLLDLAKAQQELEDALGGSVDLVTPLDLPNGFRDKVLVESQSLCIPKEE
jgi:hypothetical protein